MGFRPDSNGWYADLEAFLFSSTEGCPEKLEPRRLEPRRSGHNLCFNAAMSANFGHDFPADLYIGDDPGTSYTDLGRAYSPPLSKSPVYAPHVLWVQEPLASYRDRGVGCLDSPWVEW